MHSILLLIISINTFICNAQSEFSFYYFNRKAPKYKILNNISSNKLQIDILNDGLNKLIKNSSELFILKSIQELTTNVIKHAYATQATIHLTNHDNRFNIMLEDNGKGFNPNQISKTKAGMDISSIDKRVAHLGGIITIESEANKGTTVIIDIPLT